MKITARQRLTILQLWQRVCQERGWKSSDRILRLKTFGEILGRELESTDDIERIGECTKLMNELKVMLGVSVQAGIEADNLDINRARVLRHQILTELIPCLEIYLDDVRGYITEIMESKFRWRKTDRPARDISINDLSAEPIRKWSVREKKMKDWSSQLDQLQYTLAARLNSLRNKSGDTIHDMKKRASVPCGCSICVSANNANALVATLNEEPEKEEQPF